MGSFSARWPWTSRTPAAADAFYLRDSSRNLLGEQLPNGKFCLVELGDRSAIAGEEVSKET